MSNKSNDRGKSLQSRLESIWEGYRKAGRAKIEKVDPPVKVMGSGAKRRVIFMDNPFVDYAGAWTEQGGRSIHIEAKSTDKPRLSLGGSGVTNNQIANLRKWTAAGAVAGLAWGHGNEIKIVPARELLEAWDADAKSIQWHHIPSSPRGFGLVEIDILATLAERI